MNGNGGRDTGAERPLETDSTVRTNRRLRRAPCTERAERPLGTELSLRTKGRKVRPHVPRWVSLHDHPKSPCREKLTVTMSPASSDSPDAPNVPRWHVKGNGSPKFAGLDYKRITGQARQTLREIAKRDLLANVRLCAQAEENKPNFRRNCEGANVRTKTTRQEETRPKRSPRRQRTHRLPST